MRNRIIGKNLSIIASSLHRKHTYTYIPSSRQDTYVTVRELFEGGVNFVQLKSVLACGINSRARRNAVYVT